jgi:hypothetical protein
MVTYFLSIWIYFGLYEEVSFTRGELGWLLQVDGESGWRGVADLPAFEAANDPGGGMPGTEVDNNPKSVLYVNLALTRR